MFNYFYKDEKKKFSDLKFKKNNSFNNKSRH